MTAGIPRRLPDLRPAAHVRLRRRIPAQDAHRHGQVSGLRGDVHGTKLERGKDRPKVFNAPQAETAVQYEPDLADLSFELAQFAASLERAGSGFAETFMTAASPGIVSPPCCAQTTIPTIRATKITSWRSATSSRRNTTALSPQAICYRSTLPTSPWSASSCSRTGRSTTSGAGRAPHSGAQRGPRDIPAEEGQAPCLLRQLGRPPYR